MTDLAKLVVRLEAQTAEYQKNLEKAQRQLDKFNKSSSISAAAIGKGIATAAVAAAGALVYMAKETINSQDRLSKLSQSVGVSTEALSQLEYAAGISGTEAEVLTKSLGKLSKNAFTAARDGGIAAQSFEQLGIKLQESNGTMRPTEDLLLDIADKFSTMKDGAAKTALAMEVFGKAGAQLIPFLNQGRAGISQLTEEADKLGLTLDSKAGKAAEAFNDNLTRVRKAGAGVINQAVQEMLPALVAISERFVEAAKSSGVLSTGVSFLVGTFKVLMTAGTIITSIFQQLGRVVYGVASAVLAAASGEFRLAGQEITDAFADSRNNVANDMESIAQIWSDKIPEIAAAAGEADAVLEDTIVFSPDKAGKLAADAAAKAVEAMQSMAMGLREQVATFGMGEAAVLRYKIAHGDLAETIRTGGPAAAAYAAEIVTLQDELDKLTAASDRAKEAETQWTAIVAKGAEVTDSVKTPLDEYRKRVEDLNDLLQLGVINQETYNTAIKNAQDAFMQAGKAGDTFMEQASRNVQDILANYLEDPFSSTLDGLVADFGKMLSKMAAQAIAADIAGKLFGTGGVGSGGGWLGKLGGIASSIFGGMGGGKMSGLGDIAVSTARLPVPGRAHGGPVMAGMPYRVGEQGRAELFVPQVNGRIENNPGGGSLVVNNSFSISAPNGTISRSTEQQIAAAASRGLSKANRRNN